MNVYGLIMMKITDGLLLRIKILHRSTQNIPIPTVNGKLGTDTRQFGTNISVSGDNTIIIAGANNTTDIGRVDVLFRPGENINPVLNQSIDCPVNIMGNEHQFGVSTAVSSDGKWLFVGNPYAQCKEQVQRST